MKILFLHGWHSVVGGVKPTYLKNAGHEVINPALDDDDFDLAVRTAQADYDQHKPGVIVGSLNFPRNSGRAVTKMMNSRSVHTEVPGGVAFVGAGRRFVRNYDEATTGGDDSNSGRCLCW
jgi:hypothetical protein